MESFSAPRGGGRMEPVFIDFPQKGMKSLGFITRELCDTSGRKLYIVYIPTVPTPTGGFMEIVDESHITRTGMSLDEALRMIISAGTVIPPEAASALAEADRRETER
jgi:uncharacterized membrane protein